jgi:hypothetical protein
MLDLGRLQDFDEALRALLTKKNMGLQGGAKAA